MWAFLCKISGFDIGTCRLVLDSDIYIYNDETDA